MSDIIKLNNEKSKTTKDKLSEIALAVWQTSVLENIIHQYNQNENIKTLNEIAQSAHVGDVKIPFPLDLNAEDFTKRLNELHTKVFKKSLETRKQLDSAETKIHDLQVEIKLKVLKELLIDYDNYDTQMQVISIMQRYNVTTTTIKDVYDTIGPMTTNNTQAKKSKLPFKKATVVHQTNYPVIQRLMENLANKLPTTNLEYYHIQDDQTTTTPNIELNEDVLKDDQLYSGDIAILVNNTLSALIKYMDTILQLVFDNDKRPENNDDLHVYNSLSVNFSGASNKLNTLTDRQRSSNIQEDIQTMRFVNTDLIDTLETYENLMNNYAILKACKNRNRWYADMLPEYNNDIETMCRIYAYMFQYNAQTINDAIAMAYQAEFAPTVTTPYFDADDIKSITKQITDIGRQLSLTLLKKRPNDLTIYSSEHLTKILTEGLDKFDKNSTIIMVEQYKRQLYNEMQKWPDINQVKRLIDQASK